MLWQKTLVVVKEGPTEAVESFRQQKINLINGIKEETADMKREMGVIDEEDLFVFEENQRDELFEMEQQFKDAIEEEKKKVNKEKAQKRCCNETQEKRTFQRSQGTFKGIRSRDSNVKDGDGGKNCRLESSET